MEPFLSEKWLVNKRIRTEKSSTTEMSIANSLTSDMRREAFNEQDKVKGLDRIRDSEVNK